MTLPANDPDGIDSRAGFHAAVRAAFDSAATSGCGEIWLVDSDFADWPLGEPQIVDALRRWAHPHRKLTLLANHFDTLARRHPRWVTFRRTWSHVVECRTNTEIEPARMPTLMLAAPLLLLRLHDSLRHRGSVSRDPATLLRARETVDAVLQRSEHAFPSTILGV